MYGGRVLKGKRISEKGQKWGLITGADITEVGSGLLGPASKPRAFCSLEQQRSHRSKSLRVWLQWMLVHDGTFMYMNGVLCGACRYMKVHEVAPFMYIHAPECTFVPSCT